MDVVGSSVLAAIAHANTPDVQVLDAFAYLESAKPGLESQLSAAGRLKGVFRHTEANAALWKDVLSRMRAVIGSAAGDAICYYASEPLDNPDYELFLEDFYGEFGTAPQTTTAVATRDINRTRELLRWGQRTDLHFDRLSLLCKRDAETVLSSFTPEELLYTDLLPQFREAPACNLKRAGRNLGDGRAEEGTSACASGFIVNMCL